MSQGPDTILDRIGAFLARRLNAESSGYKPFTPSDPDTLRRVLEPGDILLIEGNQYVSSAIKYLTQSTWSHAALYIGDELVMRGHAAEFDTIGLTICFVTEGGEQFSIDCEYNEDKHKALKKAAENREWLNMKYKTAND